MDGRFEHSEQSKRHEVSLASKATQITLAKSSSHLNSTLKISLPPLLGTVTWFCKLKKPVSR